jgi:nitric oxide reductase large subunit
MSGQRRKTTLTQIKISILICIGIIAYSFWHLQRAVSQLETRLINQEPLAEYAQAICRFHYFVAVGFLVLGILLGLGIGAHKLTKDRSQA